MWRFTRFSNRLNTLSVGLISATALTILYACGDSTAPGDQLPLTEQPSSAGMFVVEYHYPDSIKHPVEPSATMLAPSVAIGGNGTSNGVATAGAFSSNVPVPTYTVASVPFAPEAAPTVKVDRICDDCVITKVPLGFSFTFFGQDYTEINLSTNGYAGFDFPLNMSDGCCTSRFINQHDANNGIIALGWADWSPVTISQIRFETRGTAPNRRFVVQYTGIGENSGNGHLTAQLILYEHTNQIVIYTTELSTTQAKRTFTQGIENLAANEAEFIAGRDSARFSLANDGVKFAPAAVNAAPFITAPTDISVNTSATACAANVTVGTATATDDAPGVTITGVRSDKLALTAAYPKGVTTITWTATDAEGLTAVAPQTVTVSDKQNPSITAPANISVRVNKGVNYATVDVGTATASDNCPNVVVTGARSPDAPLIAGYPLGVNVITWTAKDEAGNISTATQTVTVSANTAPVFTLVPANIAVNTTPGACSANVNPGTATATDDLPGVVMTSARSDNLPLSSPYPKGATIITWTATDAEGLTAFAPQTVTVSDKQNPSVTAPANISVRVKQGVSSTTVGVGTATAADNCPNVAVTGARSDNAPLTANYQLGVTTITWTARDEAGNISTAAQTITVVANQPPVLTFVPLSIAANTTPAACSANVDPGTASATDDLPGVVVTAARNDNLSLTSPYPKGVTVITWTATDVDQATASATQLVSVSDKEKPTISAPANVSVGNDPGLATAAVAVGTADAHDNCPNVSVKAVVGNGLPVPAIFPVGMTTITWTATDVSGNSASATQTITVRDVQAPSLTVPANLAVDATKPNGAVVTYAVSATDNVGVTSVTCDHPSGSVFPIGYTSIICMASDAAGNHTSKEFGVEVRGASDQIESLIVVVNAAGLPNGTTNPLVNQLRATQRDGSSPQACKKLDDFIHLVGVKDGSIPDAASADWTARAQNIQAVLGCRSPAVTKSLLTGAVPNLNSRGSREIVKE